MSASITAPAPPADAASDDPGWMARVPDTARAGRRAGRSRLDPRRVGAIVGVAGGLVFVLANLGWAHPPVALALRVVGGALAVGTHLLPFARAFRERHLVDLGVALVGIGVVATVAAIALGAPVGDVAAVIAGLVMLALMLGDGIRGRALSAR